MNANFNIESGLVVSVGGTSIDTDSMPMSSSNSFMQFVKKASSSIVFSIGFVVGVINQNIVAFVSSLGSGVAMAYGNDTIDGMFAKKS